MANKNGSTYGLTILSPIKLNPKARVSHVAALRAGLAELPAGPGSPFTKVQFTHFCRLVVLEDVIFVGSPAREEHLKSSYLMFTSNFDGELDDYLRLMASRIGKFVDSIWKHCVAYPGTRDVDAFIAYMKKCQLTTTFFFADVNDKTVAETLRALQVQQAVAAFVEANQGKPPAQLQDSFRRFSKALDRLPASEPANVHFSLPFVAERASAPKEAHGTIADAFPEAASHTVTVNRSPDYGAEHAAPSAAPEPIAPTTAAVPVAATAR